MSGSLGPLWDSGNWWNTGTQGAQPQSPLLGYAERLRAAGGGTPQPGVSPPGLVGAYTPPVYQPTQPHVDVDAIIAAMNPTGAGQADDALPPTLPQQPSTGGSNAVDPGTQGAGFGEVNNLHDFLGAGLTGIGAVMGGPLGIANLAGAAATGGPPNMMNTLGWGRDTLGLGSDETQNAAGAASNANVGGTSVETVGADVGNGSGGAPDGEKGNESYRKGGYTGNAPRSQPVGVVHGQEEVINAKETAAVGKKGLSAINKGDPEAISLAKKITASVGKRNDNRGSRVADKDKDGE